MPKYRNDLPQFKGGIFLTDGGIETTLIFHDGLELPYFAAFHLLKDKVGTDALRNYFRSHASIARAHETGFILESPNLARQRGLGRQAWLFGGGYRGGESPLDRADAGTA